MSLKCILQGQESIKVQEELSNKVSAVTITIPKGRVKGDVDGDGAWTQNDKQLVLNHITNGTTLTEIEEWCSDADGNGVISILDAQSIESMYTGSFLDTPIDYYGNWVFDVNKHYWTTDIAIDGITPNIDIVLNIASVTDGIQYCDAEVISAGIRLYAYMPPIEDTVCLVGFKTGTGNTVINCRNTVDSDVFIAEYNTTTRDEIKTAYENGKALFCKVGYYIVPFSQVTGRNRNIYIFGPTQDGNQFKCNAAGWSEGKWDGRELPSVTASDDGKFLRVVDGAWAKAEATSDSKVGDIKVTTRTDLGDAWALCNGAAVPSNATELSALIPQNEYPLSTFDVLNLASTSEVYDIYNAADGNLYVISTRYNSDNQQRQYLS